MVESDEPEREEGLTNGRSFRSIEVRLSLENETMVEFLLPIGWLFDNDEEERAAFVESPVLVKRFERCSRRDSRKAID